MKLPWMKNDEGKQELELPDELVSQIKKGADSADKVSTIETKLSELTTLFSNDLKDRKKREDDAAAASAAAVARKNHTERQEQIDSEIEELMLTNPKEAIRKATESQSVAIMTLNANNIRREVFEDSEKFKYYYGDIKSEVDKLIAGQTLAARNDPSVVENCYKTVLGNHVDELVEGKLKSRFASSENGGRGTSSGSAGSTGTGGNEKKTRDADFESDLRRAAKQVGIKYEDYVEMLEKDGVI